MELAAGVRVPVPRGVFEGWPLWVLGTLGGAYIVWQVIVMLRNAKVEQHNRVVEADNREYLQQDALEDPVVQKGIDVLAQNGPVTRESAERALDTMVAAGMSPTMARRKLAAFLPERLLPKRAPQSRAAPRKGR
jgi:hypothetical protein